MQHTQKITLQQPSDTEDTKEFKQLPCCKHGFCPFHCFFPVILPLSKAFWISFNRFFIRRFVLESRNILLVVMRQPKNGTPRKVFPNTGIFRKRASFSRQKWSTSSKMFFKFLTESPKITISSM